MTKKTDQWMPMYIGDYLADTSRLNTEQHGAYLLILMDYWRNGPPADDDEELASISKLSLAQWRRNAPRIRAFFVSRAGRLHQKRMDAELEKQNLVIRKRSASGKSGAAKRWGHEAGKPDAQSMAHDVPAARENDGKRMASAMANAWQNDGTSTSTSNIKIPPPPLPQDGSGALKKTCMEERALCAHAHAHDLAAIARPSAAQACRAMREAGLDSVNPSHPKLIALLAAGMTVDELRDAAAHAAQRAKGFAYALATAEGRRRDGALAPLPGRADGVGALSASGAQTLANASRLRERIFPTVDAPEEAQDAT